MGNGQWTKGEILNGIVERGTLTTKECIECKESFETYTGTITIKGPSPDQIRCDECISRFVALQLNYN